LTASGWTIVPQDDYIMFRSGPSTGANNTAPNSARILSGAAGRSLNVTQPITLCPGRRYRISSSNRQANLLSKCTNRYSIEDPDEVYTASPQEYFTTSERNYTAGLSAQDVSRDLKITTVCAGEGGALAGADDDGFMIAEYNSVGVMPIMEG
jgi:hypothetical protein